MYGTGKDVLVQLNYIPEPTENDNEVQRRTQGFWGGGGGAGGGGGGGGTRTPCGGAA